MKKSSTEFTEILILGTVIIFCSVLSIISRKIVKNPNSKYKYERKKLLLKKEIAKAKKKKKKKKKRIQMTRKR